MQRKLCIPQKHSLLIMSLYHRKEKRVKIKESSLQLARGGREMRIPLLRIPSFPRIVISSEARNLPCTPVKRRLWDSDETKKFCVSSPMQEAAITLRSLGSAFDDDMGRRTIPRAKVFPAWGRRRNENTAFPVPSFRAKREIFFAHR